MGSPSAGLIWAHSCFCGQLPFQLRADWTQRASAGTSHGFDPAGAWPRLVHRLLEAQRKGKPQCTACFKPLLASPLIIFIGQSKSCDQTQSQTVGCGCWDRRDEGRRLWPFWRSTTMILLDLDPNLVRHAKHRLTAWSHACAHPHLMEYGTRPREGKGAAPGHTAGWLGSLSPRCQPTAPHHLPWPPLC